MQKFSEDLLRFSFFSFGIQDAQRIWRHLAGLAPPLDSLSAACSVCQVLWLIESCEKQQHSLVEAECKGWLCFACSPVSTAPGKASWPNIGQSHGNLFTYVKRLLKSQVIKSSFTCKPAPIKGGLA